ELLKIAGKYTHIVEFWFDGGWVKEAHRWPILDAYQLIKSKESECQVGVNWSIGWPDNVDRSPVPLPKDFKEGYPIRYFPSDFRLGDPYLPMDNDLKLYTHSGAKYYMPWESTVCISGRWFYNTTDKNFKSVDELERLYRQCTKNDNILILNCPPNRDGRLRDEDVNLLKQLRERIEK
ncbi:MAG: alpha-L-fucosidase, partial [Bacteroidaceae bacterium]